MLGYGLLSLAFWFAFRLDENNWRWAFLLALLYAVSDEFHQSFVPGRHPSWVDALVIDGSGAALMLVGVHFLRRRMRKKRASF